MNIILSGFLLLSFLNPISASEQPTRSMESLHCSTCGKQPVTLQKHENPQKFFCSYRCFHKAYHLCVSCGTKLNPAIRTEEFCNFRCEQLSKSAIPPIYLLNK